MTIAIYCGLFVTTALYAWTLERTRRYWDSDLTWLAVVIGVALCLMAPFLAARWSGVADWRAYEALVWWSFAVGSIPIIIWQLARSTQAWRAVERGLNGQSDTEALAEERRGSALHDD